MTEIASVSHNFNKNKKCSILSYIALQLNCLVLRIEVKYSAASRRACGSELAQFRPVRAPQKQEMKHRQIQKPIVKRERQLSTK